MSTITAKDLTKEYPRSPYDELAGFPWLPRLIDKVRALGAGKIGEYTPFPCGGDKNWLGLVGIEADAIKAKIDSGASDQEITEWVKANASAEAAKNIEGFKQYAVQPAQGEMAGYLAGAVEELKKARPELDLSKADNFGRLICIEEGHPLH
ncbi:MAG: hypothetical protein JWM80_6163 [Cyanobacteria bacterium RYN_339]|nr:hypothetical protein [Cyanobacteria bacterium RYN_339]